MKHKTKKNIFKIIAGALAAGMLLSMIPLNIHAEENDKEIINGATEKYTYVVEHWTQNIDGDPYTYDEDNYTRVESASGTADPDATITPGVKNYTGFTAPSISMWTVDVDHETFRYYYTRNSYDLTINTTTGISNTTGADRYLYQEEVTLTASTSEGYTFSGWTGGMSSTLSTYTFKMPANDLLITANATPKKDIAYQVNYWQQNLDGNADMEDEENYTLVAHTNATGTAFTSVTPKVNTYTGFVSPAPITEEITPDGELVIDYYYKRQKFNVELTAGEGVDEVYGSGEYLYGATVNIDALMTPGYAFTKWTGTASYSTKATSFVVSKDTKLTASGKIGVYSVTYYLNGGKNVKGNPTSYKTTDSIVLLDPTKENYFFLGWFLDDEYKTQVTTLGNGMAENVKLYAKWLERKYTLKATYGNEFQNSGTPIDYSKLKIIATLSDGTSEELKPEDVKLSQDRVNYGENEIIVEYEKAKTSFTVSCDVMTLLSGQKYTVNSMAKAKREKGYKALSTDKKVAKMSSKGQITAKKQAGEATLTALRGDGSTQEFKVNVEVPKWTKKYKMSKGDVQNVNMTGTTQKVEYTSSDKTIVLVDENGNITAKKVGKAIVYTTVNGKKYKTSVTVQ